MTLCEYSAVARQNWGWTWRTWNSIPFPPLPELDRLGWLRAGSKVCVSFCDTIDRQALTHGVPCTRSFPLRS